MKRGLPLVKGLSIVFLGFAVFLLTACGPVEPGRTDTSPTSEPETQISGSDPNTDESNGDDSPIDINNVLTREAAEAIVSLLEKEPQTYETLTKTYGKPQYRNRKGEVRYAVAEKGTLTLKPTEEGGNLYTVVELVFKEDPRDNLTLSQFKAFKPGETTEEEVRKAVGVPHGYIGSGVVRALYETADGYQVSVHYHGEERIIYEVLVHFEDHSFTDVQSVPDTENK